ncbi:MAG TPA: helix-turn-helix domain-containing protein [Verrucomicrobiae bacterium]|jgi:transcriptional regulator with XRE-family HTH domain|nr:helix-turn-helix domain-containing protein [Verrucomicrobiae bacterium]
MTATNESAWDGREGTAGGADFGAGLTELAIEREVDAAELAEVCGLSEPIVAEILAGKRRVGVSALAAFAHALHIRPIEFLQKTRILGLSAFAAGLDPLYFLPEGDIRYSARIYMREINPRHAVPEVDMTRRNPILKALAEDPVLDPLGRLEVELAYLLRAAVAQTGGSL